MSIRLIIDIAKTLLMARLGQTLVAAIGVTFGITMFISLVSFMTGLNELLDGLILNRTPHIRLYNEIEPSEVQPIEYTEKHKDAIHYIHSIKPKNTGREIYNSLAIIDALKKDKNISGIAPKVTTQVFYQSGIIDINGTIFGIDVAAEQQLFFFNDYMIEGDPRDLENIENSIVLGKGVAEKMLVDIGDRIQVTSTEGKVMSLKVVGYFQLGVAEVDDVQSYTSLETAQKIMGKPKSYITDIQIKLLDMEKAAGLARQYKSMFGTDAIDIKTANTQFETGSSIRNIITYSVSITLLIVAGFGIYNILNMMIYEKMDSIAIMKATGFSGSDVKKIFLSLSMIIGVSGGLAGLICGFIGSVIIDQIPFETSSLPTVKTFPVNYNPVYYLIGILFSLSTTYISGFFPARKASKVDPVVIIRGK
ncbi:MAG TPA: FtsX-like permease family protein [Cytophagaceae bacterium]